MFFKSIYKKITEDFSFVIDYDYVFQYHIKHHVTPSVLFKGSRYSIEIGYSYEAHNFYINLFDSTKKRYANKETIQKFERLFPQETFPFKDGIDTSINILEGITLKGDSYKAQVEQVKEILLTHLQKLN